MLAPRPRAGRVRGAGHDCPELGGLASREPWELTSGLLFPGSEARAYVVLTDWHWACILFMVEGLRGCVRPWVPNLDTEDELA